MSILEVKNLTTRFHTREGVVKAVENVSFSLNKGETLGIVGESGSGKSVTCYSLMGLIPKPPGKIHAGTAMFDGQDLLKMSEFEMMNLRGKRISMIFQDPMTSLNPYMTVGDQLMEPLLIHEGVKKAEAWKRAVKGMEEVGIPNAEERMKAYPFEFSGGMRQRIMIAMALITRPEILIADEPTTALDVTVQKQVLDLIKKQQETLGTAVIFITHDLGVVAQVCDHVNVMYAGRTVEQASVHTLFTNPRHAYTRALLKSIPANHKKGEELYTIPGLPPILSKLDSGCAFRSRNTLGRPELCFEDCTPELTEVGHKHFVQNCPGCLS